MVSFIHLDEVFGNLLAVLQDSDGRDDPVPLHPDQSLASVSPRVENPRMRLFIPVVKFCRAPRLKTTITARDMRFTQPTNAP